MNATELSTRRPVYVIELDDARLAVCYTDCGWNGGWVTWSRSPQRVGQV